MTSNEMKNKVMHYLRIKRDYALIATEAGRKKRNHADILASNFKEIIEVEVKISKSDLKADFDKNKHARYKNPLTQYTPNRYFFAVPKELVQDAILITKDTGYGVMEVSNKPLLRPSKESFISIVKSAELLKERYCKKLEHEILMRLSSEVLRLRIKYLK